MYCGRPQNFGSILGTPPPSAGPIHKHKRAGGPGTPGQPLTSTLPRNGWRQKGRPKDPRQQLKDPVVTQGRSAPVRVTGVAGSDPGAATGARGEALGRRSLGSVRGTTGVGAEPRRRAGLGYDGAPEELSRRPGAFRRRCLFPVVRTFDVLFRFTLGRPLCHINQGWQQMPGSVWCQSEGPRSRGPRFTGEKMAIFVEAKVAGPHSR